MPTWRQDSNGDVTGDISTVVISGNTGMVHLGTGDQIVHVHNDDDATDDD